MSDSEHASAGGARQAAQEAGKMSAIEAKGLCKRYLSNGATVEALRDVDLVVEDGEFLAVMGPSGSGKSTLLHLLGALDVPDAGAVTVAGRRLAALNRKELALVRRRHIGFVFQFFNLVPTLTVEENAALPAILDGAPYEDHLTTVLDAFGLSAHRTKLPSQLSGGEQQRVAIARALVNRPVVVLADEPTGNLDRASGAEVMALLRKLHSEGQTIVVVTHDPAVASFAERVVFMRDGELVDETRLDAPGETSAVLTRLVQLET
jgi:putative ABC transport system ATP-binding protein